MQSKQSKVKHTLTHSYTDTKGKGMEGGSQSVPSPSSLLRCEEDLGSLDEEIIVEDDGSDHDDEYIRTLLEREIAIDGSHLQEFLQNPSIQRARSEGVHYVLRKRVILGFGTQTAYASVAYLDRFISRRSIDGEESWAIRLLSMACLSLAAKLEEIKVPALSDFCEEDYNFESSAIQRMELMVLNVLGWEMGSLTPFNFIRFFAKKFSDNSSPQNLVSKTEEVILSSMRDAKIMCMRPSVIAAAATLYVLDQELPNDALQLKIGCLISSFPLQIESIISCYNSFQELNTQRLNHSNGIESPLLSPNQLLPNGNSSVNSTKRKRLVFEDGECSNVADEKPDP